MTRKTSAFLIVLALSVIVLSMTACASADDSEVLPERPRMALADAADILELSEVLPSGYTRQDPQLEGVGKEDLGLGSDASEVEVYEAARPYQRIVCFLRVVESDEERRKISLQMFDEEEVRSTALFLLDGATFRRRGWTVDPEIEITYPDVGAGAVLATGRVNMRDDSLTFNLLWYRSRDIRVFVYVQSWHVSNPRVSVIELGEEIEGRIDNFKR